MNKTAIVLLAAFLLAPGSGWARCMEGQVKQCLINGKKSTMECKSGSWTKCGSDSTLPDAAKPAPGAASSPTK